MLPVAPHNSGHSAACDRPFIVSSVGRIGAMFSLRARGVDAFGAYGKKDDPYEQGEARDGDDDLICAHVLSLVADSGRRKSRQTAIRRPNRPAFSAYMAKRQNHAILDSPKQEDLKWLTTIFPNRRTTGLIACQQAKDPGQGGLALSSRASLSCLCCSTLFSAGPAFPLNKTQAQSQRQRRQRPQCQANKNTQQVRQITGRGATLAPIGVSAAQYMKRPKQEIAAC